MWKGTIMRRFVFALFAALSLLLGLSVSAGATGDDCGDYVSRAAAQSVYDADPSDPGRLDGNDQDRLVCETYDYAGNPGTNPGVVSGDDTGSGDDDANGNGDAGGATDLPNTGVGATLMTPGSSAALFSVVSVLALIVASVVRRTESFRI
jgi:hypothetical protein